MSVWQRPVVLDVDGPG